jgi:hypothetical protein
LSAGTLIRVMEAARGVHVVAADFVTSGIWPGYPSGAPYDDPVTPGLRQSAAPRRNIIFRIDLIASVTTVK